MEKELNRQQKDTSNQNMMPHTHAQAHAQEQELCVQTATLTSLVIGHVTAVHIQRGQVEEEHEKQQHR